MNETMYGTLVFGKIDFLVHVSNDDYYYSRHSRPMSIVEGFRDVGTEKRRGPTNGRYIYRGGPTTSVLRQSVRKIRFII